MIAALYVQTGGCYFGTPGVDPWDEPRDARLYAGPFSVVAHPPCERWGRYWFGSPSSPVRLKLGDDGGCFKAALASVRRWGGVLEHPEASAAWQHFGLTPPTKGGVDCRGGFPRLVLLCRARPLRARGPQGNVVVRRRRCLASGAALGLLRGARGGYPRGRKAVAPTAGGYAGRLPGSAALDCSEFDSAGPLGAVISLDVLKGPCVCN